MDTEARIRAAKERLKAGKQTLLTARESGPPCGKCEHVIARRGTSTGGTVGPYCGHPAYTDATFTPDDGKLSFSQRVKTSSARAIDGLCGPEAALFDQKPIWRRIFG